MGRLAVCFAAILFAAFPYGGGISARNMPEARDCGAPANCFVITGAGEYSFLPLKGDGTPLPASVSGVRAVWQFDGDGRAVELLSSCSFDGERVRFRTAAPLRGGNALIAAEDSRGNVLWSWHIWLSPEGYSECAYDGIILMDRNLGSMTSTWGGSRGGDLYWQWGRKDPFPREPLRTVRSDAECGTEAYATSHPDAFITGNGDNFSWLYTGDGSVDGSRWAVGKTVDDPCPAGWRIPDGGLSGTFSRGDGMRIYVSDETGLGAYAGDGWKSWLPACGYLGWDDGVLANGAAYAFYWTLGTTGHLARHMMFFKNGYQTMEHATYTAYGQSVRCQRAGE